MNLLKNTFSEETKMEIKKIYENEFLDENKKIQINEDKIKKSSKIKIKKKNYKLKDFQFFIPIINIPNKIYKSINKHNFDLNYFEKRKCLICTKTFFDLENHLLKCIEKNTSVDKSDQNLENDSIKENKIEIDVSLLEKGKKRIFCSTGQVVEIKKQISDIFNISRSKLHLFKNGKALKNTENVFDGEIVAKYKN